MGNLAAERMLQVVQMARSEAKRAEYEFDRRNSDIQRKAGRSIDLFGGSATSQVADIARDARRACDDLYTAYQSLVRIVDEQCRPLLDQEPDLSAVKEVCDLIKWLNDESEIENNFTASLNSRSLGDVASARYVPTMDNKMIQRYWENKYAMWPGRAEQEARERAQAEERRRIQQEAALAAQEKARQEQAAKMEAYEQEHKEWAKKKESILRERSRMLQAEMDRERSRLQRQTNDAYEQTRGKLRRELDDCTARKTSAEARLASLGFFAFGEKSEAKKTIQTMIAQIASLESELAANESWYQNEKRENDRKLREAQRKTEARLEKEHPIPAEPRKPAAVPTTAQQVASWGVMQAILDFMEPGKLYTITDILTGCPACMDMTNLRVSAMIRQMIPQNIERIEEKRKAYFRMINPVLEVAQPAYAAPAAPSPQRLVQDGIQRAILDFMEPGKLYTIVDLVEQCPVCADLTNQRCSALVRQLVSSGDLERIENNRMAYFRKR